MKNVLIEALVVGIIFLVLGILTKKMKFDENQTFFIAGFMGHLLCEITGINRWYCKNGNACA